MGKTKATKRAQRLNMLAIQPQTPSGPATVPSRAVPMSVEATRSALRNEKAPAAGVTTTPGAAITIEEELAVTRKDEIEALPVFKEVTGLEAVDAGITMYVVPLRSGEAKECYFDETTTASTIGQKTQKLIEFVDKRANGVLDGASLADLSIDGMVNVVALRNTSFKNQIISGRR